MKKITMTFIAGTMCLLQVKAQNADLFNLGTGVVNSGTGFQSPGVADDTWDVKVPGATTYVDAIVSNGDLATYNTVNSTWYAWTSVWDDNAWAMWISPHTLTSGPFAGYVYSDALGITGNYEYKTTFTTRPCPATRCTLYVDYVGADDELVKMTINGNDYSFSGIDYSPLTGTFQVPINPAHILSGSSNTITFTVRNDSYWTGFYMAADLEVIYGLSTAPSISGTLNICSGNSTTLCCNYMPSSNITLNWSTGVHPAPQCITVSPSSNTTYSVTVTNQYGCLATASATVTVNPNCLPNGLAVYDSWEKHEVGEMKMDGIGDQETLPAFKIFPNPGSGLFTIEAGEMNTGKIRVLDMMGKNVSTIEMNGSTNYTLDLTGYAKGIYTVMVVSENQSRSHKIVLE